MDANEIHVWKHVKSGEIRVSYKLPGTPHAIKMELGDGNWCSRDLFDHLKTTMDHHHRQGNSFRTIVVTFFWFLNSDFIDCDVSDISWSWYLDLRPDHVRSACIFYNALCAQEHAPMNLHEFTDLVADLVYVQFIVQ